MTSESRVIVPAPTFGVGAGSENANALPLLAPQLDYLVARLPISGWGLPGRSAAQTNRPTITEAHTKPAI